MCNVSVVLLYLSHEFNVQSGLNNVKCFIVTNFQLCLEYEIKKLRKAEVNQMELNLMEHTVLGST